jgi:hypothetical protein
MACLDPTAETPDHKLPLPELPIAIVIDISVMHGNIVRRTA